MRGASSTCDAALRIASAITALSILMINEDSRSAPTRDAATNYMLNCQGCHKADGSGQPGRVPPLRNSVSRFLSIAEGRAYLGRVPGTSESMLGDRDRAEVLNWIVTVFDREHLPPTFTPYTEEELARYRHDPVSQAGTERARILTLIASTDGGAPSSPSRSAPAPSAASTSAPIAQPPPQFAVCGACHPTSTDGASAMGPNLRGVIGRHAGTLSGFNYSAAMRESQIVWTRDELNAYLTNVPAKLPGSLMAFAGLPNPAARAAVIDYLATLQ